MDTYFGSTYFVNFRFLGGIFSSRPQYVYTNVSLKLGLDIYVSEDALGHAPLLLQQIYWISSQR